jgi:hypothetical protein
MPQPTPSDLHVDKYLTDLSVAFVQDASQFVAGKVFPVVGVSKQSDKYPVFPKGFFWRDLFRPRPLGGAAPLVGYEISEDSYIATEYALAHAIDDRVYANTDDPLDPRRSAVNLLTQQAMIQRDRLWATTFFAASLWDTDWTGVDATPGAGELLRWNVAASDPIGDIHAQIDAVHAVTGFRPNKLVLGMDVITVLLNHADVLDRIKYTQFGMTSRQILATLLQVDEILVPGGVYESAAEGATSSIGLIANAKDALLIYSAPSPGIEVPSAGYTFAWTGLLAGTAAFGGVVSTMREERNHSDIIEMRQAYDMKLVASELGVFFDGIVA